jgi:hypothetical protein
MRKTMIAAGWLLAMAGAALAQQNQGQSLAPGTAGPQPGKQQGSGLFNRNEPAPMYSSSSNSGTSSLQAPGSEPLAGNTGASGSGGGSTGWAALEYGHSASQRQP